MQIDNVAVHRTSHRYVQVMAQVRHKCTAKVRKCGVARYPWWHHTVVATANETMQTTIRQEIRRAAGEAADEAHPEARA